LLTAGKSLGRDDDDLLLLVQSLVKLDVSISNSFDISKSLIFSKDFQELDGQWVESSNGLECSIELSHLSLADSCVLGELLECIRCFVECLNVNNILIDCVKSFLLGGSSEKDSGISSLNSVIIKWGLVVSSGLDDFSISSCEGLEEIFTELLRCLSFGGTREIKA
jgi:hypothetical protein